MGEMIKKEILRRDASECRTSVGETEPETSAETEDSGSSGEDEH